MAVAAGWFSLAAGGLLVALTGTRWLGFYLARLADSGPPFFHLHVVPYVHVVFGVALLLIGWRGLRSLSLPSRFGAAAVWRFAGRNVALASGCALLLLPLFPFAVVVGHDASRFHVDELTLAGLEAAPDAPHTQAAGELRWARGMVWTTLIVAVAVWTAGVLGSRWLERDWIKPGFLALAPFMGLASAFTVAFYLELPGLAQQPQATIARVGSGVNWVLPLWEILVAAFLGVAAWRLIRRRADA